MNLTDPAAAFLRLLPWIRSQFPQIESLRDGTRRIYLDNAAGTLVPRSVADAMADAAVWANPQPGRRWPAAAQTLRFHREARQRIREFLNAGDGDPVFFSESTTSSLLKLRLALEPELEPDDLVVVSDADHFANITPWEWRRRPALKLQMEADGSLDPDRLRSILTERVRLVALPVASNGLGAVPDLPALIRCVREYAPRAWVVLDAVHAAPHVPIDLAALDADALAFSTYKLFGPFAGVLWVRPSLAERLRCYAVEPHTDLETALELGTLNNVTIAGILAALTYLESVGTRLEPAFVGAFPTLERTRRRFKIALAASQAHEAEISRRVLRGMAQMRHVELLGERDERRVAGRVPTFGFHVADRPDDVVEAELWARSGIQVAAGNHYAGSVLRGLGKTGAVRASFAHYNTLDETDGFLRTLASLAPE